MNDITKLRKDLETLKIRFGKFPDMLCSTCGGYEHHIFSVLGPQDIEMIKSTLESATFPFNLRYSFKAMRISGRSDCALCLLSVSKRAAEILTFLYEGLTSTLLI